jgi:hypothetical protein
MSMLSLCFSGYAKNRAPVEVFFGFLTIELLLPEMRLVVRRSVTPD